MTKTGITLGQRITVLRRRKGWTESRLAQKLGADIHSVSCWERGKNEPSLYYFFNPLHGKMWDRKKVNIEKEHRKLQNCSC